MTVNFAVHSIMYSYFALRAMGVRVPKAVSMLITTLQLSQMVLGIVIICRVFLIKLAGTPCQQDNGNLLLGAAIYSSYFVLFVKFFVDAYLSSAPTKAAQKGD